MDLSPAIYILYIILSLSVHIEGVSQEAGRAEHLVDKHCLFQKQEIKYI